MRNACRKALFALTLFIASAPSWAQNPNGLSVDSVHPDEDAATIALMRKKMEQVRTREGRPTVALVLSGGGAKGAAQLGVKKLMDELGIPVDMICGTSIGGLIGGLLAVGYSPEFIDSLFTHQDWSETLTDRIDPSYVSVESKMYKSRFLLSVPFHYQDETFNQRVKEQELYSPRKGKLHLGANDNVAGVGINSTASSLPAGYANGFNVNNLLSSLTVGYQDSMAFKDLPIPFFCVATELISCKAKNWENGELKTAMRSTMSIPGLFKPVRTRGMVLVDGGMRNNFPVDLAREMGADYVIGVELSDRLMTYSELNNIGDMAFQMIDLMGKEAHDRNIKGCDIFVKPDLEGYNMLSFKAEAIDTMIERGHRAAMLHRDEFVTLKKILGEKSSPKLHGKPAVDINRTAVQLRSVQFKGLTDKEALFLQNKIKLTAGQFVTAADMKDAMSKIQATGCMESVTYSLLGTEGPYDLVINCNKSPVHQVGFGLRADNVEWVSILLNLGLNKHKLMGSKFDFNLKFGPCQYFDFKYSLDLPHMPTVNADFRISHTVAEIQYPENGAVSAGFWSHRERLYLSNMKWTRLDVKAGLQNQYFEMPREWFKTVGPHPLTDEQMKGNYCSAFINAGLYTLDDHFFPSKGVNFNMGYELVFAKSGNPDKIPYHILFLNWKPVIPIGERFAIIPDIHYRSLFTKNSYVDDIPIGYGNYAGGGFQGRFFDQAVPVAGYSGLFALDDNMVAVNLAFRVSPVKDLFVTAECGALRANDTFSGLLSGLRPDYWGVSAGVGYDSIFGPLKLQFEWSERMGFGYYLSLGYDF